MAKSVSSLKRWLHQTVPSVEDGEEGQVSDEDDDVDDAHSAMHGASDALAQAEELGPIQQQPHLGASSKSSSCTNASETQSDSREPQVTQLATLEPESTCVASSIITIF